VLEKLADLDRVEGGKGCLTKTINAPDLERKHG
jgi:hypothetical protein